MQAPGPTTPGAAGPRVQAADMIVGAGPAGSTAAAHLARAVTTITPATSDNGTADGYSGGGTSVS